MIRQALFIEISESLLNDYAAMRRRNLQAANSFAAAVHSDPVLRNAADHASERHQFGVDILEIAIRTAVTNLNIALPADKRFDPEKFLTIRDVTNSQDS